MTTLDFEIVTWLERNHGSAQERATFGELRIRAGGFCLTETQDRGAQTTRSTARLSLFHLADWLLWNRWRLLYEPGGVDDAGWAMSHQIGGAGGGFLWPALTLSCDGEAVTLSQQEDGPHERMIRYLCSAEIQVPRAAFERAAESFLAAVMDRLTALGLRDNHIAGLHQIVRQELADEQQAAMRRDEALLGLDPDEVAAEQIVQLRQRAAWMGREATDEVFAQARIAKVEASCRWIKESSTSPDMSLDLTDLAPLATAPAAIPKALPPWERGGCLAQQVRQHLGLAQKPVDLDALLHARIGVAAPMAIERPFAAGFRLDDPSRPVGIMLRRRTSNGRRFEAARILADALFHSTDRILPVTDRATARQKVQRAFAQELLSPVEGLRQIVTLPKPSEREIDEAAEQYGVSPWTVRSALVNRGLVDRSYLPPSA
jgi:hypothetical protein